MFYLNNLTLFLLNIFFLITPIMSNTILFSNPDANDRTIIFTPNDGSASIPNQLVPARMLSSPVVSFPQGWSGSFRSILPGTDPNAPKIIGEIQFQGYKNLTYYDVSAVDTCCDNTGVRYLETVWGSPSGCITAPFPCSDSYSKPGDIQTKTSEGVDFICGLGDISLGTF